MSDFPFSIVAMSATYTSKTAAASALDLSLSTLLYSNIQPSVSGILSS